MTSPDGLPEALAFLVGRWQGEGTWGDAPFACRTDISVLLGRYLQIDVRAEQDGRAPHEERVVVHAAGERLVATLYPDRGDVQVFDVQTARTDEGAVLRLVFTPPAGSDHSPQRWTIRQTERGYDETFEVAPGGGPFRPSVICSYHAEPGDSA